jgi:tRNA threonylcarbamoyladenosine biosynthesis protein TsaB
MILLGFDTSTAATVVGLWCADGRTLEGRDDPTGEQRPGHATRLLPLAGELLDEAGVEWGELERIVVGVGPGTFTGLRIGIATARGLAQSLATTLVGVSSLRALAQGVGECAIEEYGDGGVRECAIEEYGDEGVGECAIEELRDGGDRAIERQDRADYPKQGDGVLAAIDARRGEMFVAAYDGEIEVAPPRALAPEAIGGLLEQVAASTRISRWTAVGDGAVRYRRAFERTGVLVPDSRSALHRIHAQAICVLGARAPVGEAEVVPDYRRLPDAQIALEGVALR